MDYPTVDSYVTAPVTNVARKIMLHGTTLEQAFVLGVGISTDPRQLRDYLWGRVLMDNLQRVGRQGLREDHSQVEYDPLLQTVVMTTHAR